MPEEQQWLTDFISTKFFIKKRMRSTTNKGIPKGDSPQCGEMSRSDKGDGRPLGETPLWQVKDSVLAGFRAEP